MPLLTALAALALGVCAQAPAAAPAPAASTTTAVDQSTAAAAAPQQPAVAQSTPTAPSPEERPIKVFIHKESKDWEPISVRGGGTPGDVTSFKWQVKVVRIKGKKKAQGPHSSAKAFVHVYPTPEGDKRLVVSIFPKALLDQRLHVELRLLLIEGYLEKAQLVEVQAPGGGPYDDAVALTAKGVDFQEESPESAEVRLTAVDPAPGKEHFNAGLVAKALFPERRPSGLPDLGRVDLEYSVYGVSGPARPRAKRRAAKKPASRRK